SREALKQIIFDLIERNKIETSGIKMIVTGGYSSDSFEPGKPNFIITQQPVKIASEEEFEKGVRIMLYDYLRDVPTAKSINYLMAVYLQKTLAQKNAGDVLYCNNNRILEFPRSNVFIVTPDKRVVTPLDDVLHGITRKKVLEIAGKEYQAEQRAISVEELKRASEVFLTSTTKRLLPVLAIDDHVVGDGTPGEITRKLCKEFIELEKIYCAKQSVGS
ncbi:MAG: aminotransferase class IV, partial [Bacteroidota bacterium]|nr:aminotransferase class IV [Bacteroidota bacterium]